MTALGAHNSCCQPHKSVSTRDGEDGVPQRTFGEKRTPTRWVVGVLKGRKTSKRPNWIRISRNSTKSSKSDPILIHQDRVKLEVDGKQVVEGEVGTLDVTAFTLATLFRTVPVDEWYNQRSRGTPVLDEDRGE
ncbi:hypothetical protein ALC62_10840 [Cyphomyrmex costatus]|uniref:Uncharacterized protein n=1 Tax=Cyphomyrmex costatus TaxID=456900 RepID=A0A195CEI9_9HYME|nr:hypothetical protein ALC62_10840 [Cyphomyrmex costatus]